MAEIFLARPNPMLATADLLSRRSPIVVKRLFAHHSSEGEFVRMFFNEARLASRIKHPNIVDIFDQGEADSTYYLAMEYIHGEDLRGIAQQSDNVGKRPAAALICRIIMDTLAGLHYAHTLLDEKGRPLGLVHRDVSPQNVLVTYDGVVKLIDFGIAKATRMLDSEQTQAGMIKGKYAYMSPEQTRGEQLDARSDVFSAGTLLWELLTWRRLFKRATDLATLVAVTEEPAPSMLAVVPDIPKELDEITLRALAPNRNDRWGSAKEFHDALNAFVRRQGWDASPEALGRYMTEIFADKLAVQAREAAPSPVEEKASSGLPIGPRPLVRQPSAAGDRGQAGRPRAMTMPLQVLNPALAQQARKAMVVPKSDRGSLSGAGPASANSLDMPVRPGVAGSSSSAGLPPAPSSRSGRSAQAAPPPAADPASMPMRIVPDGSSSLRSQPSVNDAGRSVPGAVPIVVPSPVTAPIVAPPLPELAPPPLLVPSSTSRPDVLNASATGTLLPAQQPDRRWRVYLAVFIGILIGILAVLALQLLALRHR